MREHLRAAGPNALTVLLACAFALLPGGAARGQDVRVEGDEIVLRFDEIEGTPLDDFIQLAEEYTGFQLTFSSTDTRDTKLRFLGEKRLPREEFWRYFQAVLKAHDFIVVPYGNTPIPGSPMIGPDTGFFAIRRASSTTAGGRSGYIKTQAPVVTPDQLEYFRYDPGIVLTTNFTMRYVSVQEAANMLQIYFADPQLESIRAVPNTNAMVATGFAQTLYGIGQLLELIDVQPSEFKPALAKVELEHAVAEEIKPIIDQLIAAERGTVAGRPGVPSPGTSGLPDYLREPEPHIEADPRTNVLLVVAASTTLEKITGWIRMLDVEVDPRGDTHVYRLKNSASAELEEVLNEWAQNSGAGTATGGTATAGAAGQAGIAGGGRTLEQPITVVADENSNSLIITASKSRYAQILEIVKKLDVRRRQVLIQSALVEISGNLNERLGVELGYVSIDDTPDKDTNRGFGVSNFSLSELSDTDGDGIVDTRIPIGFSDGFSGTSGLTAGIFSGKDFAIPVVINALKTTSDANVLSMPSVLVNDNEEAEIRTITEQPTFNISQGVNSDQTSFDEFVEAGITLRISPSISAGNYLRMLVELDVSSFTEPEGNPPPRATRAVTTNVTLPDGHTMVIGGIVEDQQRNSRSAVPWFGELPLVGFLFRTNNENDIRTNLYVFITPHIISDDFSTLDDISYLKKQEMEALNGKIHLVDDDWDRDNADTRMLDASMAGVFDLPSYASPAAGEVEEPRKKVAEEPVYGEQPASPPDEP